MFEIRNELSFQAHFKDINKLVYKNISCIFVFVEQKLSFYHSLSNIFLGFVLKDIYYSVKTNISFLNALKIIYYKFRLIQFVLLSQIKYSIPNQHKISYKLRRIITYSVAILSTHGFPNKKKGKTWKCKSYQCRHFVSAVCAQLNLQKLPVAIKSVREYAHFSKEHYFIKLLSSKLHTIYFYFFFFQFYGLFLFFFLFIQELTIHRFALEVNEEI